MSLVPFLQLIQDADPHPCVLRFNFFLKLFEFDLKLIDFDLFNGEPFSQEHLVLYLSALFLGNDQPPILLHMHEPLFLEEQVGPYLYNAIQHDGGTQVTGMIHGGGNRVECHVIIKGGDLSVR